MGWLSEDYEHEGYTACEMPDGRLTCGTTRGGPDGGVAIMLPDDQGFEYVDGRDAVGWRARCDCRAGWVGPLWRRVTDPDQADMDARLVYDPEPTIYGDPPAELEDLIHADWKAHAEPAEPSEQGENVTDAVEHGEEPARADAEPDSAPENVLSEAQRRAYVDGLVELARWLETRPDAVPEYGQRFLLALHTNGAVEDFAARHGLEVAYDDPEGNASADVRFGAITLHVYGYTDWDEHIKRAERRDAEAYAAKHGMTLIPADPDVPRDVPRDVPCDSVGEDGGDAS